LELAPQRVSTFLVLVNQELLKADYWAALRAIRGYEDEAPWIDGYFIDFKEAAEEALREEFGGS
jgi:hypothetical protein